MKSVYDRKDGNLVSERKVIIEGSGKHCHVTRETLDILFGEGFELEIKRWLTQPGQYSTPHKVKVVGPRKSADLTIIGPPRKADQIELSLTDARAMGISAPIRESGDLAGSPGIKLIGPKGEVDIEEGVIIAKRHVHFTPEDAEKFGVKDKQIIIRVDQDLHRKIKILSATTGISINDYVVSYLTELAEKGGVKNEK